GEGRTAQLLPRALRGGPGGQGGRVIGGYPPIAPPSLPATVPPSKASLPATVRVVIATRVAYCERSGQAQGLPRRKDHHHGNAEHMVRHPRVRPRPVPG